MTFRGCKRQNLYAAPIIFADENLEFFALLKGITPPEPSKPPEYVHEKLVSLSADVRSLLGPLLEEAFPTAPELAESLRKSYQELSEVLSKPPPTPEQIVVEPIVEKDDGELRDGSDVDYRPANRSIKAKKCARETTVNKSTVDKNLIKSGPEVDLGSGDIKIGDLEQTSNKRDQKQKDIEISEALSYSPQTYQQEEEPALSTLTVTRNKKVSQLQEVQKYPIKFEDLQARDQVDTRQQQSSVNKTIQKSRDNAQLTRLRQQDQQHDEDLEKLLKRPDITQSELKLRDKIQNLENLYQQTDKPETRQKSNPKQIVPKQEQIRFLKIGNQLKLVGEKQTWYVALVQQNFKYEGGKLLVSCGQRGSETILSLDDPGGQKWTIIRNLLLKCDV